MVAKNKLERRNALKGGIVAGIVAGLVMALFLLIVAGLRGDDAWGVLKGAAMPFLGDRVAQPGFDAAAVLLGTISHLAVSVAWGLGFGLLFYGVGRGATVGLGALWGLVAWLVMFYVVLPILGLGEMTAGVSIGFAAFEHLLFGTALGIAFLPYQRRIEPAGFRRTERPEFPSRPLVP